MGKALCIGMKIPVRKTIGILRHKVKAADHRDIVKIGHRLADDGLHPVKVPTDRSCRKSTRQMGVRAKIRV